MEVVLLVLDMAEVTVKLGQGLVVGVCLKINLLFGTI